MPDVAAAMSPVKKLIQNYDCCICNISGTSTVDRPFVIITMCQGSKVLHHRYLKEGPFTISTTVNCDSSGSGDKGSPSTSAVSSTDTEVLPPYEQSCGAALKSVQDAFQDFFNDKSSSMTDSTVSTGVSASTAVWPVDIHATLCGSGEVQHVAHFDCHHNYLRVNRNSNDINNVLEQLFAVPAMAGGVFGDDMEVAPIGDLEAPGENEVRLSILTSAFIQSCFIA